MRILFRLLTFLKSYWKWVILAVTCLLLGTAFSIGSPELLKRAIDTGIAFDFENGKAAGDQTLLIIFGLAILGANLLRGGFGFGRNYLGEFISQRVAYDLRNQLYDRIQRLSFAFHDKAHTGQLMSRATQDVEAVRMFVSQGAFMAFITVYYISICAVLFIMNWQLALISLACMPLIAYRALIIGTKLRPIWTGIQEKIARLGTILQENLSGVKVVRAFSRERYESAKFEKEARRLYEDGIQAGKIQAFNTPLMTFLFVLSGGLIIWFGGREVMAGNFTVGELTQFYYYLMMMIWPIAMLGWMVNLFSRGIAAGKRIFEILDTESAVKEATDATGLSSVEGLVRFEGVSFGYDSFDAILDNVSLKAKPGEMVALVGATGSGKSTLVNLIPRFYDVTSGRIIIDGIDIRDVTLSSLRQYVGIVQQDVFLFSATIKENIAYGAVDATMEEIVAATKAAYLHNFIESLPEGYETSVGERGVTLSGGQKQRLAIARTILMNPRILILDDSTSSVDTETEFLIQRAFRELMKGRTTFVIAQRLQTVKDADQILVLDKGRIVERGAHQQLLEEGKVYPQIYELQLRDQVEVMERGVQNKIPSTLPAPVMQTGEGSGNGIEAMINGGGKNVPIPGAEHGQKRVNLRRARDLVDDVVFGKVYDHKVVIRLLKYLKEHKALFTLAIVSMLVFTLVTLAAPYLAGFAIDGPIASGNLWGWSISNPSLMLVFLALLAAGLLQWGSQYLRLLAMVHVGQRVFLTLRTQMFNHLQKLSLSFYDRHEVGRIMSRVQNDIGVLQEIVTNGAVEVVADLLGLGGALFMLFFINPRLAVITLTVIPALAVILFVWQKYARRAFIRVRQAISVVNTRLQENISGARAIQSLSREDENLQRFDDVNDANVEVNLQAARFTAGIEPIVALLMGTATALVVIFGGAQVLAGELLPGELIAFALYVGRFFEPVHRLTYQYTDLQRAMAGGQRIFEVLDTEPEIVDAPDAIEIPQVKGEIDFNHVHHEYLDGLEVLQDINLRVHAGETVALVGATGAGKSTVANLVGRFYEITKGTLSIDGYDIQGVTQKSLRRQIGVVLQDPFLFSGTVRENILYGRDDATDEELIEAASAVGANDFIQRLEKGYDTELQERGSNLSVGQRQLISFARAVLADPQILILDEATANIDTQTEIIIQRALRHLLQGRTSLIIAHRLSTIHDADRVIVLDEGKIVEMGTHQELLEKGGIYHNLYTMSYAYGDSDQPSPDVRAN